MHVYMYVYIYIYYIYYIIHVLYICTYKYMYVSVPIAQSTLASKQNLVVLCSNPTRANFSIATSKNSAVMSTICIISLFSFDYLCSF